MNPGDDTDDEVLARVRLGDEAALAALFQRYHDRLGRFSYSFLRRRELAEEAVANVFINVWRRRETIVVNTSVRSYLFAAVINQSLNLRRGQTRHSAIWLEHVPNTLLVEAHGTDRDVLYRELVSEIESALERLPPRQQAIFRMSRFEGLRYAEIAKSLGMSSRMVQNQMLQALKQLALDVPKSSRRVHVHREWSLPRVN